MVVEGSLTFAWDGSPDEFDSLASAVATAVAAMLDVDEAWVDVQVVSDNPDVVSRRRLQGNDGPCGPGTGVSLIHARADCRRFSGCLGRRFGFAGFGDGHLRHRFHGAHTRSCSST